MSEWLTYSLSELLLFSPRTYYRLFELYNVAIWPAQIVAAVLGLATLALMRAGGEWRGRGIAAILAACWLWVAWAYLLTRYDSINWAAKYFAVGFAIEALLLIWTGSFAIGCPCRGRRTGPAALGSAYFFLHCSFSRSSVRSSDGNGCRSKYSA